MNISLYFLNYTFFFKMFFISIVIGGVLFVINFTQAQTIGKALIICPEGTMSSVYEGSPEQFHAWYYPPTSTVEARCDLLRIGQGGATRVTSMASWSAQSRLNFPGFTVSNGLVTVTNVNGDFPVLQVQYGGLTTQRSLSLTSRTVPPPSTPLQVNLTANPTSVVDGGSVALSWTVSGSPSTCIASGGWSGSKSVSGGTENTTVLFGMGVSQTFILTCYRGSESKQSAVSVTRISPPPPVPNLIFTASGYGQSGINIAIPWNEPSYLHWSTSNVTSCTASDAWSGTKSLNNSEQVFGGCGRSDYTLSCSGPYGSITKTAGIMRSSCEPSLAISVNLVSDKNSVPEGGNIALAWTTSGNPDSCIASGGWSGSKAVGGSSENQTVSFGGGTFQTFTLTCSKAGVDPVTDSVSITKEVVAGDEALTIKRNNCSGSSTQFNLAVNEEAPLVACDESDNLVSSAWTTGNDSCISLVGTSPTQEMRIKAIGDSTCFPTNITVIATGYIGDSISVGISGGGPSFPAPRPTESSTWKEIAP